jgi:DNA replication licensing factor MCM3
LTSSLFKVPHEYLPAFAEALKSYVLDGRNIGHIVDVPPPSQDEDFFIGVEGAFGANLVSPRVLSSPLLRSLVAVDGIVTKGTITVIINDH